MKRILIAVSVLALACVLTCQAAIVSDVLTVYNDNAAVVAQIGVNEDGSVFFTGFGALGTAGGSGTGCDPDATSCPLAGSEDPYLLMFINSSVIAPDPAWYGNGIVLHEPDGTFSDLVTVFNTGTDPDSGNPIYALGFYSGALGPFDGVTGSCPVGVGYPTNCDLAETQSPVDVTSMLDPELRNSEGYTATFQSFENTSVPEPATLGLLGIGLALFGWRKRSRARA